MYNSTAAGSVLTPRVLQCGSLWIVVAPSKGLGRGLQSLLGVRKLARRDSPDETFSSVTSPHDPSGASSIEWFDQRVRTGNPDLKQRLLDYNEDDCVAMRVVLDAMKGFEVRG